MNITSYEKAKLLAPAGSIESLRAAINNGADCCYLGYGTSNMRANAKNFTEDKFIEAFEILHDNHLEGYMTLNTIYFPNEINEVKRQLDLAAKIGVDGIICWDPMIIFEAKQRNLNIHVSTQASISNVQAAKFYEEMGAKCVVLARECSLKDMLEIRKSTKMDIEVFVHGAMCVAISGRCFMSQYSRGKSANRGECLQPCRYPYEIQGIESNVNFKIEDNNVLSPKDLCTMSFLDLLLKAGATKLKIEGRARGPEYVAVTTKAYRTAIDAFYENKLTEKLKTELLIDLKTVFNREFSNGFYMGMPVEDWSKDGNFATQTKEQVGFICKVYPKINVIEVLIQVADIKIGDKILVTGERCGAEFLTLESMQIEHEKTIYAPRGASVGIKVKSAENFRTNDKVYLIKSIFS